MNYHEIIKTIWNQDNSIFYATGKKATTLYISQNLMDIVIVYLTDNGLLIINRNDIGMKQSFLGLVFFHVVEDNHIKVV